MSDSREQSIRAQIDRCDEEILRAVEERVYWVRRMHDNAVGVRTDYGREMEIGYRYVKAVDRFGLRPAWGFKLAHLVVEIGKAAVRRDQAESR